MASSTQVLNALTTQIKNATANLTNDRGNPVQRQVGTGYPPEDDLAQVGRDGIAAVAVYDRKLVVNSTRWSPTTISDDVTAALVTATFSETRTGEASLGLHQSITIDLAGPVGAGDAIGITAQIGPAQVGQVASSQAAAADASALAIALAANIAADPSFRIWLSARAEGATVVLTGLAPWVHLFVRVGNGGTRLTEIGRRRREFQILVWTNTEEDRDALGAAIFDLLAKMNVNWTGFDCGILLPDGTFGRVEPGPDYDMDDNVLGDVFRHDFLVAIDHPVTATDRLYTVLAAVQAQFGST